MAEEVFTIPKMSDQQVAQGLRMALQNAGAECDITCNLLVSRASFAWSSNQEAPPAPLAEVFKLDAELCEKFVCRLPGKLNPNPA